ncbi:MAG: TonB-dependent receptor plug domain-containing protein [Planctomycetota bacterium]
MGWVALAWAVFSWSGAFASAAGAQEPPARDLTDLSLEELLQIEVTSVSRKQESLLTAASAVTVIRGEDLRRLGVQFIPEVLRLAPGFHVGRIDANKWSVGARGFGGRYSNKLLVLVDGRTVYSPLFSGVFWEFEGTLLEDVDRIEVIRGPGAAMWGSNAVNGVVNIITRSSRETQGGLVSAGAGDELRFSGAARYGGSLGEGVRYRAFAKAMEHDEFHHGRDDWRQTRAGFRADWALSDREEFVFTADVFDAEIRSLQSVAELTPPFGSTFSSLTEAWGGHALARWERRWGSSSSVAAQLNYDHTEFDGDLFGEVRDTLEGVFTYRSAPLEGHDLMVGLGGRVSADRTSSTFSISMDPEDRTIGWGSVFIQDEIALADRRTALTLGLRAEYGSLSELQLQPSLRGMARLGEDHVVWGAVSRAVRTPSRAETDFRFNQAVLPGTPPTVVAFFGDSDFRSETVMAYELGYRSVLSSELTVDAALFYSVYEHLRTVEPDAPFLESDPAPAHAVMPFRVDNRMDGRAYGAEVSARWNPAEDVSVHGGYSFLRLNLDPHSDSADSTAELGERRWPRHQAFVRLSWDPGENVNVDLLGRYVGPLSAEDVGSYVEADVRVGWRPWPGVEFFVSGRDLMHDEHAEVGRSVLGEHASEPQRAVFVGATWRF